MNAFAQPSGLPAGTPVPSHAPRCLQRLAVAHTCVAIGHEPPLFLRTVGHTLPSFAHPHP